MVTIEFGLVKSHEKKTLFLVIQNLKGSDGSLAFGAHEYSNLGNSIWQFFFASTAALYLKSFSKKGLISLTCSQRVMSYHLI